MYDHEILIPSRKGYHEVILNSILIQLLDYIPEPVKFESAYARFRNPKN